LEQQIPLLAIRLSDDCCLLAIRLQDLFRVVLAALGAPARLLSASYAIAPEKQSTLAVCNGYLALFHAG
jgi:hypothetical protein